MNNKELKIEEQYLVDEGSVSKQLRLLPRVAPPSDFEMRLRARIAGNRTENHRTRLLPLLAGAGFSAILLVAIGAVLYYSSLNPEGLGKEVVVREGHVSEPPHSAQDITPKSLFPEDNGKSDEKAASEKEDKRIAGTENSGKEKQAGRVGEPGLEKQPRRKPLQSDIADPAGGSEVRVIRETPRLERPLPTPLRKIVANSPEGIKVSPETVPGPGFESDGEISVKKLLEALGISAEFDQGLWVVRSADSAGVASRSGIRAGDVVEAVGDEELKETTKFRGLLNIRSLRIRRDGVTRTVVLGK